MPHLPHGIGKNRSDRKSQWSAAGAVSEWCGRSDRKSQWSAAGTVSEWQGDSYRPPFGLPHFGSGGQNRWYPARRAGHERIKSMQPAIRTGWMVPRI